MTDENQSQENQAKPAEQKGEGQQAGKRGGRKPKVPEPELGMAVLFVTASETIRPAVITALPGGGKVDLTVFNSQGAVPQQDVGLDPDGVEPGTFHFPS